MLIQKLTPTSNFQSIKVIDNRKNSAPILVCSTHGKISPFLDCDLEKESIKALQKDEIALFCDFISRKGKVSKQDYDYIIANHPSTLVQAHKIVAYEYLDLGKTTPDITAGCAIGLKNFFDKTYGNNYTVISIGRSPAAICEAMQNAGSNVIFMPISSIRETLTNKEVFNEDETYANLIKSLEYIKRQGVNDENKEMNFILLDYCCNGKTIKNVENFIHEYNKVEYKNLHPYSIIETLKDIKPHYGALLNTKAIKSLGHDMFNGIISNIANVPYFPGYSTPTGISNDVVFKEFDDYSQKLARAYSLLTINEMEKIKNVYHTIQ